MLSLAKSCKNMDIPCVPDELPDMPLPTPGEPAINQHYIQIRLLQNIIQLPFRNRKQSRLYPVTARFPRVYVNVITLYLFTKNTWKKYTYLARNENHLIATDLALLRLDCSLAHVWVDSR